MEGEKLERRESLGKGEREKKERMKVQGRHSNYLILTSISINAILAYNIILLKLDIVEIFFLVDKGDDR